MCLRTALLLLATLAVANNVKGQDPLTPPPPVAVPDPTVNIDAQLQQRLEMIENELQALREAAQMAPMASPPAGAAASPAAKKEPAKFPSTTINGFFQADAYAFGQEPENRAAVGDIQDGAGFRRTRLSVKGGVSENVNYFVQMDFGFFGRPTFTDVWGEVTKLPGLGNVRVGQWKQPYSLEVATSVRYQPFLERSLLFQAFSPFRHIGAGFYDHNEAESVTWAMSVFRTGNDQFGNDIADNGGVSTAGRLTWLPYYEECPDKTLNYFHLGGAFWYGTPDNERFRYSTIPEAFVGAFGVPAGSTPGTSLVNVPSIANGTPPFVDTGVLAVNSFEHFGTEMLWVRGNLSLQSEVMFANVEQVTAPALFFWGYYAEASWFLTGESRRYDRKAGALDRILPHQNFVTDQCGCGGPGAWELLTRVSHVDLNDRTVTGGSIVDLTSGVNWYLNPYTKFQANYVHSFLDRAPIGRSEADIVGARFQVDF